MTIVAGLDVGGAHLKVALAEGGSLVAAGQFVCPLWQGLDRLDAALAEARSLTGRAERVAVTMTGELSDLFESRRHGVEALVQHLVQAFGLGTRFWIGSMGFGSAADAIKHHTLTGSTNFLATATLVASRRPDALLIDFGSTTADIIPIAGGQPVPRGLTDAERQATGELVYTGYTRTAVMGVASRAPVNGQWVTLAREHLATMADVRRLLGEDLDGIDLHATADGKGKSLAESASRLARMLGRDAGETALDALRTAAAYVREEQRRSLIDGVMQVLSGATLPSSAAIVAAGIGASEVKRAALQLDRPCLPFGALIGAPETLRQSATFNAPAVAVALLSASASG